MDFAVIHESGEGFKDWIEIFGQEHTQLLHRLLGKWTNFGVKNI